MKRRKIELGTRSRRTLRGYYPASYDREHIEACERLSEPVVRLSRYRESVTIASREMKNAFFSRQRRVLELSVMGYPVIQLKGPVR